MITNYTELQAAVALWLNRQDMTAVIPDLITIAEKQIARRLRRRKAKQEIQIAGSTVALPGDVAELSSIRLVTGEPHRDHPLTNGTSEIIEEHRANLGGATGRPTHFTVVGNDLVLAPAAPEVVEGVSPYTAEIVYFRRLIPLSGSNPTNDELTEAPDLYLFGALKEAAPYLEHDERVTLWEHKFEKALTELETVREREEFNASLRPMRLPLIFG